MVIEMQFKQDFPESISERNLNPKAACLKRREDEKTEDISRGVDEMSKVGI